jgi:hypothetical protein
MIKIEVVEFLKLYNIDLGFKFKNSKYKALILNFEPNSTLIRFYPYEGKFLIILDLIASLGNVMMTYIFTL